MEQMNDLRELLNHDVQLLHSAEEQIIAAMPAMIAKAHNPAVKQALEQHLRVTERQRERIDQVRQMLGAERRFSGKAFRTFGKADGRRYKMQRHGRHY
jgi:ferritin-like metal-binding protein YciE